MGFFRYLLVIALTVLVTLGCVYGFSRISCEGCDGESGCVTEEESDMNETLSARLLSEGEETEDAQGDGETEVETAEVKQWVRVTFDVVVIALSVGVIIVVWLLIKRVMRKYGGPGRRFG